ncbi:glycosyltransferase family 2 protein [uncultured Rikenella sp.]|uniref:glycosyltransferase family 2 protein n=1 Tax=uncultured Rikenella sp. TaxID=368003 RepID=UPI0025FB51CC|nr:glycosyltransferase family 2 protein [uncultured Rikenella sp.]
MTVPDYTTSDPQAVVVYDYIPEISGTKPEISVVVSTYNQPEWLEKVLWGYEVQSESCGRFEVVIADDGSDERTRQMLDRMTPHLTFPLRYVWQTDTGFRKCRIVNRGILATRSEYIVVTDGDCIPRSDFLATHLRLRRPGCFLSGGAVRLPMELSRLIGKEDILTGRCFDRDWLKEHGLKKSFRNNKLTTSGRWAAFLNAVTPAGATWNGGNASGWKSDLLRIGGYDERMEYGGEDRELGERLMNAGIKGRQVRYSAVLLHLEHGRGYVYEEAWERNRAIRKETARTKSVWTSYGFPKEE